jgi:hypothetical protein
LKASYLLLSKYSPSLARWSSIGVIIAVLFDPTLVKEALPFKALREEAFRNKGWANLFILYICSEKKIVGLNRAGYEILT